MPKINIKSTIPSMLKVTMGKPMTEPPLKATVAAYPLEDRAAWMARTFA